MSSSQYKKQKSKAQKSRHLLMFLVLVKKKQLLQQKVLWQCSLLFFLQPIRLPKNKKQPNYFSKKQVTISNTSSKTNKHNKLSNWHKNYVKKNIFMYLVEAYRMQPLWKQHLKSKKPLMYTPKDLQEENSSMASSRSSNKEHRVLSLLQMIQPMKRLFQMPKKSKHAVALSLVLDHETILFLIDFWRQQ